MIRANLRRQVGAFRLAARLDVPPGVTALCGPSGSGKTTVLQLLLGLTRLDAGEIRWHEEVLDQVPGGPRLPPEQRRFGVVFQDGLLFPHLDVGDNIRFGLPRRPSARQAERLAHWTDLLGLAPLLHRRPRSLSGGEQRRAALARALAPDPRALLLDEPLSGLDGRARRDLLLGLRRLKKATDIPILFISHQPSEVLAFADRVVRLEAGRVLWTGEPARLLQESAGLGTDEPLNFMETQVRGVAADGLAELAWGTHRLQTVIADVSPGDAVTVSVRPSDVLVAVGSPGRVSAQNRLDMPIRSLLDAGARVWIRFDAPDPFLAVVTARACRDLGLHEGQTVTLLIKSLAVTG